MLKNKYVFSGVQVAHMFIVWAHVAMASTLAFMLVTTGMKSGFIPKDWVNITVFSLLLLWGCLRLIKDPKKQLRSVTYFFIGALANIAWLTYAGLIFDGLFSGSAYVPAFSFVVFLLVVNIPALLLNVYLFDHKPRQRLLILYRHGWRCVGKDDQSNIVF